MESLTTKEFLEKLKTNSLTPLIVLKGKVKKTENESDILFAGKPDFTHWIKIPSSMIASVVVIKSIPCKEEPCAFVKLHLQTPTNAEAKVFYELLSSAQSEDMHHGQHESMHHCGCQMEHGNYWHGSMNSMCHNQGMMTHGGCHCPCCNRSCNCGCMSSGNMEHGNCHR